MLGSLPPGSYLTVSNTVRDIDTERVTEGTARLNQRMGPTQLTLRTRPDFERFFAGLEMVEPGVVPLPEWRGPGSQYPIPCTPGWAAGLSDQLGRRRRQRHWRDGGYGMQELARKGLA